MAVNKKVASAAAAVVVVAGATGAGIALTRGGEESTSGPDPTPGTYATAPKWGWDYALVDPNTSVLFTTDTRVIASADRKDPANPNKTIENIIGIDLATGRTAWQKFFPGAMCGSSIGRYAPDSTVVVCHEIKAGTLRVLSAEDGSELGTPHLDSSIGTDLYISNETIYSCILQDNSVTFQAGGPLDLARDFSFNIPLKGPTSCDLEVQDSYAAAHSIGDNWVTVVGPEGTIVHQSFDSSAEFKGDGLLTSLKFDSENSELPDYATVLDVDGNRMYEYSFPIATVFTLPGREIAEVFIDDSGSVRDRITGQTRWNYSEPAEYTVVGAVGDVLVMFEDGARLRGYDIRTGEPLWAVGVTQFYKGGRPPADVDLEREFSGVNTLWRFAGDGQTLLVSTGNLLTGIDITTGETSWTRDVRGWILKQHQNFLVLTDKQRLRVLDFG
ncbi:hypothetical protein ACWPOB_21910 [Rhodococcus sp. 2H158]